MNSRIAWGALSVALGLVFLTATPAGAQTDVWLSIADLYRLDLATGEAEKMNEKRCYVYDMQRSESGSHLYIADAKGLRVRAADGTGAVETLREGQPYFNMDVVGGVIYALTQKNVKKPESREVEILNTNGQAVNRFKVGKYASRIVVTPDRQKIIVADLRNNSIEIFSPQGKLLFELNLFKAVDPSDPASMKPRKYDRLAPLTDPVLSPDGKTLYLVEIGGASRPASVWQVSLDNEYRVSWINLKHAANVRGATISPDGRFLFLGCIHHISKIDLEQRRELAFVRTPRNVYLQEIEMSPAGDRLLAGGTFMRDLGGGRRTQDAKLLEISLKNLRPVKTHTIANFSPDNFVLWK